MAPERLHIAGLNSSVLRLFLNVKNVSAERVWTSREFHTVGEATQNALDANAMVAGGCCNSRADVECKVLHGW